MVSFLFVVEKGIIVSKFIFIIWFGGLNEWVLINVKVLLRKKWYCWFMICDMCFYDKCFFIIMWVENKKKKSCF